MIAPYTGWIRTFGSTHGLENAARIARELGLNTAIRAWLSDDPEANEEEMTGLIRAAKDGYVDIAVVGSEVLLRDELTPDQLIGYIERFRSEVPAVPVTTADVHGKLIASPAVMDACDVILANYYPYWEGRDIEKAVAYLHASHQNLAAAADGKEIIVSETGWPSGGDHIGEAVPSPQNASYYFLNFVSWARAENVKYFYFEAFDEPWKSAYERPQGSHWGVFDENGSLKAGMQDVFDGVKIADNWSCILMPGGEGDPMLRFAYVPPIGGNDDLEGQALHVVPADYRVAVYIKVGAGWWTKPYFASPATTIACDGSWICDITTGGSDASATEIAAYLIPAGYTPPAAGGGELPGAELALYSVASLRITRQEQFKLRPFRQGRKTAELEVL
jgi:exo-beta-1,3-glucanase (GH17 family)